LVAPSNQASDAGLRPDPFPDRAASLLPGLLAATRTGLTPAGDDELMLDHDLHIDLQLWAHLQEVAKLKLVQTDAGTRAIESTSSGQKESCGYEVNDAWSGEISDDVGRPNPISVTPTRGAGR
jgi:hypothetical protein